MSADAERAEPVEPPDAAASAPSRTAAIGGTRVARSAGRRLAISVTMIPAASAMTIVDVPKTMPLFGSVKPTASNSLKSPLARPSPRKSPVTAARIPITSASITIEVSTCRRLAPSVRIVANSRVRWAIVIESEFAITKLPTKSAMPPNASRKPRRKLMNESVCFASSAACAVPVRTWAVGGRIDWIWLEQLASVDAGLARDRDLVEPPVLLEERLRRRQVEAGQRRAAERRRRAELDDARDAELLDRPLGLHADRSRRR